MGSCEECTCSKRGLVAERFVGKIGQLIVYTCMYQSNRSFNIPGQPAGHLNF